MTVLGKLTVELGARSYPIYIGDGLIDDAALLRSHIGSRQVAVVTNEVVRDIALERLLTALEGADTQVDVFTLADGEAEKNLDNYARILDFLLAHRHNRTTTLVALGGGVVGDIAGFAAATYQRGVNVVQIPTTLLAQVDSSVGGKTAVNHRAGKNMIGAFHQPVAVLADLDLLGTLPERELRAGFAEVIKYGVIADADFFTWLESNTEALLALERDALVHAIARSCEIKAAVVAEDERETGKRALLNYGHTFAHAIESLAGFGTYLHGEAVAIGMVMAADLAVRSAVLDPAAGVRICQLIEGFGLPTTPPQISAAAMLEAMGMDKKAVDGALRFVLAREIGAAFVTGDIAQQRLGETLTAGSSLLERGDRTLEDG
jgi:3-dehydroquinate synthase